MAQGGIYDHLGGGFARYATDAEWLVPHFEKMLYDNAQLLELLALAHADRPEHALSRPRGGDGRLADARHARRPPSTATRPSPRRRTPTARARKGRFYVWTEAEIDAVLGADSRRLQARLRRDAGAATGKAGRSCSRIAHSWPTRTRRPRSPARGRHLFRCARRAAPAGPRRQGARRLERARHRRPLPRGRRVRPPGLAGPCRRCLCLHPRRHDARRTGGCSMPGGSAAMAAAGLLDDQAAMARAALALVRGDRRRRLSRRRDRAWPRRAERWFAADAGGGYFTTAADAADLPLGGAARPRSAADDATPAGNGLMAEVLARLYHLTGEPRWRDRAQAVLRGLRRPRRTADRLPDAARGRRPAGRGRRRRRRRPARHAGRRRRCATCARARRTRPSACSRPRRRRRCRRCIRPRQALRRPAPRRPPSSAAAASAACRSPTAATLAAAPARPPLRRGGLTAPPAGSGIRACRSSRFHTPVGDLTVSEEAGQIVALDWGWGRDQAATPLLRRARAQLEAYFDGAASRSTCRSRPPGRPIAGASGRRCAGDSARRDPQLRRDRRGRGRFGARRRQGQCCQPDPDPHPLSPRRRHDGSGRLFRRRGPADQAGAPGARSRGTRQNRRATGAAGPASLAVHPTKRRRNNHDKGHPHSRPRRPRGHAAGRKSPRRSRAPARRWFSMPPSA